jgi:hypothetical protein
MRKPGERERSYDQSIESSAEIQRYQWFEGYLNRRRCGSEFPAAP